MKSQQLVKILLVTMMMHQMMALPMVLEHALVDSDATIYVYDATKSELAKHNNNCRIAFGSLMMIACQDGWLAFLSVSELGKFIAGKEVGSLKEETGITGVERMSVSSSSRDDLGSYFVGKTSQQVYAKSYNRQWELYQDMKFTIGG